MLACLQQASATATRKSDSGNVSRIDLSNTSIVFFSLSLLFFFFSFQFAPLDVRQPVVIFVIFRASSTIPSPDNTKYEAQIFFPRYFTDASLLFFLTRENIYPRSVFRLVNRPRLVFFRPSSPLFLRPRFRSPSTTREQAIVKPGSNNFV